MDKSESISCAICSQVLDSLALTEREEHYEHHFHRRQLTVSHKSFQLLGKVKRKWMDGKENDVFWYPSQATLPPSNYTPGRSTKLTSSLSCLHYCRRNHTTFEETSLDMSCTGHHAPSSSLLQRFCSYQLRDMGCKLGLRVCSWCECVSQRQMTAGLDIVTF
jgi:hypothetical protein